MVFSCIYFEKVSKDEHRILPVENLNSLYVKGLYGWHVDIIYESTKVLGSGIIVTENLVITPSKTISNYSYEQLTIRGGDIYRYLQNDNNLYNVKSLVRNPEYEGSKHIVLHTDLAMLFIHKSFTINLINYQNKNLPALDSEALKTKIKTMMPVTKQYIVYINKSISKHNINRSNCLYSYSYILSKSMLCSLSKQRYMIDACFENIYVPRIINNNSTLFGIGAIDITCKNYNNLTIPLKYTQYFGDAYNEN